jgi:hypothetical protein
MGAWPGAGVLEAVLVLAAAGPGYPGTLHGHWLLERRRPDHEPASIASKDAPVLGPVQVVSLGPDRLWGLHLDRTCAPAFSEGKESRDRNKISSDQSVHGSRAPPGCP